MTRFGIANGITPSPEIVYDVGRVTFTLQAVLAWLHSTRVAACAFCVFERAGSAVPY